MGLHLQDKNGNETETNFILKVGTDVNDLVRIDLNKFCALRNSIFHY